jgi:hypothetical protein
LSIIFRKRPTSMERTGIGRREPMPVRPSAAGRSPAVRRHVRWLK